MSGIATPDPRLGAEHFVPMVEPMPAVNLFGTKRGFTFERYFTCSQCHLDYKEHDIQFYNGKPFGIPCGCFRDIASLQNKGKN